ncbi:MAG: ABC transporter permease subunit [Chthoniobacterales bacterium]|nr:ABC transporter permease subunit [Chthoniobacterales bacterium]
MRTIRKAGRQEGKQARRRSTRRYCLPVFLLLFSAVCASGKPLIIGSKKFTESYVLAEIAKHALSDGGLPAEHRQGMGGTIILWEALRTGQIAVYPEYTGTIAEEILKSPAMVSPEAIRAELAKAGVGMTDELGFNNTYALVMRRDAAEKARISKISDLRDHPELRFGLTHEFLNRQDGWPPLAGRYRLAQRDLKGIDHGLGYEALRNRSIDVKDAYSTDAKIAENNLVALEDDLRFFPQYKAVFLHRLSLPAEAIGSLQRIAGSLDEARMIRLNAEAERTKDYARAAGSYFRERGETFASGGSETLASKLLRWTARHLQLAGISLLLAVIVGVPLGIMASKGGAIGHAILAVTSAVQTIPSLALLALLVPVPFFGISARTAIAALFLYGLLPIVRNTASGLQDIAQPIRESAIALGLTSGARLRQIYLPMASRTILAGIKTSAVINIGTATLAALIGAGGLGEPIISGLNLNDHATILQGAIPAAVLALLVQWSFDLLDRFVIPKGLRL